MHTSSESEQEYDLICVGGGIMSSTLALLTKILNPDAKIGIFERLGRVGFESSNPWNNAGTGHSGYCELNYTPKKEDGSIDIEKAVATLSQFVRSKEFWSYLVKQGWIENPENFIETMPHHSWVRGEEDVEFLEKRYQALQETFMFENMKFSKDPETLKKWFPVIMNERASDEVMAATRMEEGTEVNFGALTEMYFSILKKQFDLRIHLNTEVSDITRAADGLWTVKMKNKVTTGRQTLKTKRVFIGAGGKALNLLQKTGIKEKNGYGGFPVSGEFLFCKNPEVINKHWAKVYSKAGPDAPPMSTPHLDSRYINGKRELLFGPFAGFSTKFLKKGSYSDLFNTIKPQNIKSLLGAFWHNLDLSKYLIGQLRMKHEDRMEVLRDFVQDAKSDDWELIVAGQRVQTIKADEDQWGKLQFGTELVNNRDGSINALLGASPGASTAVHIMLEVLKSAFPDEMESSEWQEKLEEVIPFWNKQVDADKKEFEKTEKKSAELLHLDR